MSVTPATSELAKEGRLRSMADFYWTAMRTEMQAQFQYRAATYMYLFGMVAEPVIYLVVWSTIADQAGGSVSGLTAGQFAAYYIVWTLVRTMNIVFTPYGWEWRIREGQLSGQLLRPLHPIHYDVEYAKGTRFGKPLAHGLLLASLTALGASPASSRIEGFAFIEQGSRFLRPVVVGDTIRPRLTVERVWQEGKRRFVRLATALINQRGETVLEGFHVYQVLPPASPTRPPAGLAPPAAG